MRQDFDRQTGSATRLQPDEPFSSQHQARRHRAYLKGRHDEHDAHYMKSEEAADAPEAALSHSLEGDWKLVQKKGGVHDKSKSHLRPHGLSRMSLYGRHPPPRHDPLRPRLSLNGRSAGGDASQDRHGSGSPPIHHSQNTQSGACLSANRQSGESGNDVNWKQAVEASKTSAKLDETTRLKRDEEEASELHKARVASLSPDSSLPDPSSAGLPDSEYDTPLNNDYCPHDLEIIIPTTGARSVSTVQRLQAGQQEATEARRRLVTETVHKFLAEEQATTEVQRRLTTTQLTTLANELGACEREKGIDKMRYDAEVQNMRDTCDSEVTDMQDECNNMGQAGD